MELRCHGFGCKKDGGSGETFAGCSGKSKSLDMDKEGYDDYWLESEGDVLNRRMHQSGQRWMDGSRN